jgi:mannose/cellobiose epimerase-like protein (N-acyl-D-glucosamine 2-epimerase family)
VTISTPDGRSAELGRLLAWGRASGQASGPGTAAGFGYLGDDGTITSSEGLQLWINTRMTHVYGLAALLGHPGAAELASRGLDALNGVFHDDTHDGWYARLTASGEPVDARKEMYGHAFVVLAGATATAAGLGGAETLLGRALDVVEHRFWDDDSGACREGWDQSWQHAEAYGGVNCNMHAVEAFLAAGAVTGDAVWTDRALRIASRFIHGVAREHHWRLPEHFSPEWEVLPEYNADRPRHRFRPYGVTVGHLLEWSRLLLHLERAVHPAPAWLLGDAVALFDTAVAIGWAADGRPGLVYTVDWSDRPVVAERMHWVAAEGAMTAEALTRRTGQERFAGWAERLWGDAARFVDQEAGGWWHELDPHGTVSRTVWSGKPDLYHAVQAMLLPDLPFTPSLVTSVLAVAQRGSD